MRSVLIQKHSVERIRISIVVLALWAALLSGMADAQNRPYFKAFGGDIFTGGWFKTNDCINGGGTYLDPLTSGSGPENGGIYSLAKTNGGNANGGASSQFAAFSLGTINNTGVNGGFYSGGATTSGQSHAADELSFANTGASGGGPGLGGNFQGSVRQGHCIPDYFNSKRGGASTVTSVPSFNSTGKFYLDHSASTNPLNLNDTPSTISGGINLTIFVKGNVYIGANIEYSPAATVSGVPKFALVVSGSIYIGPGVDRLDGLYVAQPDPLSPAAGQPDPMTRDTGVIWTCHEDSTSTPSPAFLQGSCVNKLTVNGAFIAKQVNLLRLQGDVQSAPAPPSANTEDTLAGATGSGNVAELINYTPAMVIGGPFFNQEDSGVPKIQSLVNLPPVF